MYFELLCLILLLFTLQGRSWERSMFTAQCLTTSLQSSLLSSFLTLGVTRLPTSTASWVSSTIQMTMNSNAMKPITLQTLPIFLFRKIQQLIKVYVAETGCCGESVGNLLSNVFPTQKQQKAELLYRYWSLCCVRSHVEPLTRFDSETARHMCNSLGQLSCYFKVCCNKGCLQWSHC